MKFSLCLRLTRNLAWSKPRLSLRGAPLPGVDALDAPLRACHRELGSYEEQPQSVDFAALRSGKRIQDEVRGIWAVLRARNYGVLPPSAKIGAGT